MSGRKRGIRQAFRTAVLARDRETCRICGVRGVPLDAHHITDRHLLPNGGYVVENGISLCERCHWKAELAEPGFTAADLYRLIGSSLPEAAERDAHYGV